MNTIPHYLETKLASLNITTYQQIKAHGHREIFAQLKLAFPSLNYQALYDLYCISQGAIPYNLAPQKKRLLQLEYKQLPPRHAWLPTTTISKFLQAAAAEAQLALARDEIPIGAVVVYDNQIIGRGFNRTRKEQNILAHAELIALSQAQQYLGNFRLNECDLYVTIEPCLMCSGAIINSRIRRLIYGACEPKTGACRSQCQVFNNKETNHHCHVIGPVNQEEYSQLISNFFRNHTC